jgi:hypothetical protein
MRASDLDGREYDLPGGLPAGPQVVLIASKRWQQVLIEMWRAWLRRIERDVPALEIWELALLPKVYAPARPVIDGGMRAGIADPAARRRTLTAYVDLSRCAEEFGVSDFETVHAMLVGPDGDLVWRASGKPTAEDTERLQHVLAWWSTDAAAGVEV